MRQRACTLVIVFFVIYGSATCCAAGRMVVVPITPSEGSLNQWLYTIGLMQYGLTRADAETILAKAFFCGSQFGIREQAWPKEWGHAPSAGPYYAVCLRFSTGELAQRPIVTLVSTQGIMTHAVKPILGGTAVGVAPLVGNHEVIECVKANQTADDNRFAIFYWDKFRSVEGVLHEARDLQELEQELSVIFAGVPSGTWTFQQAKESYQQFRSKSRAKESFITCDLENGLRWDSAYAIRLTTEETDVYDKTGGYRKWPARPLTAADWERDTIANVYLQDKQVVAILLKRSNYEGCIPLPLEFLRACSPADGSWSMYLYSDSTHLFWRM